MKRRVVPLAGIANFFKQIAKSAGCDRDGNEVRQENASVLAYEKLSF
jgi:hypothetical protein